MKVVLLENVKNIGKKGDVKEIKDGYAMNCLIPQGKANAATSGNVKQAKLDQSKKDEITQSNLAKNEKEAKSIDGKTIIMKAKTQGEKLFGALSEKDIKEAMSLEGLTLTDGKMNLTQPIKTLGKHKIELIWGTGVNAIFTLEIEGEK